MEHSNLSHKRSRIFEGGNDAVNLNDVGLIYKTQRIGPMTFRNLRNADYGTGFRMPTMPELVSLVYASLENRNYGGAKEVIKTLKNHWIAGNTGILYTPEGMYVQDNPNMEDGGISMNQKVLEGKLGRHQEKGVLFSNDRSIRFTPYNYKTESQSSLEFSQNSGIIALIGGEENAEKLTKASEHYCSNPYFLALDKPTSPEVRVGGFGTYFVDNRLYADAYVDVGFGDWYSFGVKKIT